MSAPHLGSYNTSTSRTHVRFQFSTHAAAGGNVAPNSAFEAADLRIYRANSGAATSATQRSSANGITMTSPFDSLTGVHDVDIDLTDNTDAGFYAEGYQYTVMLCPDETVDGQTLTGVVLAYFEIGQTVSAASLAAIADAVLDEALSGHLTAGSLGQRLAMIRANTAQAGAAGTITLDASASAVDDFYNGALIFVTAGTGVGQARSISDYVGSTKVASVSPNWATNPSSDSVFVILPGGGSTVVGTVNAQVVGMNTGVMTADAAHADLTTELQNGLATSSALSSLEQRLRGIVVAQGTIGSTGNSTTTVHLTGLTFSDDEINDMLLVIFDVSESEYHARWVADWAGASDLATVATLPFTPQNGTDTYWLLPVRRDITTLDAAGVRAAIGMASANFDTQIDALPTAAENATAVWAAATRTLTASAGIKKNTAYANFHFLMVDSNGQPVTGATITAQRVLDGGSYAACANSASEIGSGTYKISFEATDLNGDTVTFRFSASGAETTYITIKTAP